MVNLKKNALVTRIRARSGSEEGSIVEMILITAIMLVGCIMVGGVLFNVVASQSKYAASASTKPHMNGAAGSSTSSPTRTSTPAPSPSICIINVNTNACSTAGAK
jgi:hypothetical protein